MFKSEATKNLKLYFIEAWGLGTFMISACLFATILEYPLSPIHIAIHNSFLRLVLMGIAMGLTAFGILNSRWGKLSGAHINPAVTIVNYRLGKIKLRNALGYILFQTAGGTIAVYIMQILLRHALIDAPVQSVVTIPYCGHTIHAFFMELSISFILMFSLQIISNSPASKLTPMVAGFLVMAFVVIAGPVSGFGMNPARTFASALPAHNWNSFWIYLIVPVAGMLLGNETYLIVKNNLLVKFLKSTTTT